MKPTARRACFAALALLCAVLAPLRAAEPPPADAAWKVHQTTKVTYPLRPMREGITHGTARVRVSVAADGQLLDALLVACTHLDFGDEAMRVVKLWRFEAERVKGEPIGVVAEIVFAFDVNGTVAVEKRAPSLAEDDRRSAEPLVYQAVSMKELDRIPAPSQVVPPAYPKEWSDRGIAGTATVEFYIDETGRARLPLVTASSHPLLASSALTAVSGWKFEAPTRRGQPVLVHASQVFRFDLPKN